MTAITLTGLTKRFGSTTAVDDVSLTISSGELFFLLGPSGCGKTTLLRMIAGFIEPAAGSIRFDDREVTLVPPNRRNTGMVFQSYALWPHMTVEQNVAYGLDVRKVPKGERSQRVGAALASVHMESYARRKPNQLSGGQQQRVALARALVVQPTVLLLDEPLSNLDAKLRLEMRSEIRRICTQTRITTVYVTHDQKEALSMADRMAVLRDGRVVQSGGPRALYQRPASRFVADFLGETNFLPAVVRGVDKRVMILDTPAGMLRASPDSTAGPDEPAAASAPTVQTAPAPHRRQVTCSIRPEALRIVTQPSSSSNAISGRRVQTTYLGEVAQHHIQLADGSIIRVVELNPPERNLSGESVHLVVEDHDVIVLLD
jgi:iron(III) transport system ATP-binding protein